ncbi:MAG TPA: nucleotidyl transferase AbiEii/AbiGii toxin family protein [Kribbella sp.]|nr:nucleotidyl transferase AbiEii/AbiGii toxin family protein [Kribbella sp.]
MTAETFWRELTERVRLHAERRGTSPQQELQQFVLQRIMARNFSLHPDRWLLKGGQTLLARFPDARATGDADFVGIADVGRDGMVRDFDAALRMDLGDHLTFERTSLQPLMHHEAARLGYLVHCGKHELMEITTDLLPADGRPHWTEPELIPFPEHIMPTGVEGEAPQLRVLDLRDQLAHKIVGMYMHGTRDAHSKCEECLPKALDRWSCRSGELPHRVQDLADVAFLASKARWDATETWAACQHEIEQRLEFGEPLRLPSRFRVPNPAWVPGYAKHAALTPGLKQKTLRDVWPLADAFVTPLIRPDQPSGHWEPERTVWVGQTAEHAAAMAEPAKQRILVVADTSGRAAGAGGLPVVSGELTTALAERDDVEVTLLTFDGAEEHGNARIIGIRPREDWSQVGQLSGLAEAGWPSEVPGLPPEGSDPYDVIVGHSRFSGPAAMHIRNRWYPFAKLAYVEHSPSERLARLQGDPQRASEYQRQERLLLENADLVVGVGPLLTNAARSMSTGVERTPSFHELVPGTEPAELIPAPEPDGHVNLLFTVPRMNDPIKGYETLLDTVQDLRAQGVPVRLRVRGVRPDEMRTEQRRVLDRFGPGTVELLPYTTDRSALRADLEQAQAAVVPSLVEGYAMVASEAAAAGVPVLITEDSGFAQLLADESRVPSELGRPAVVADQGLTGAARAQVWSTAIKDLGADYPARRQAAAELASVLQEYSWKDAAAGLAEAMKAANPDARRYTIQGNGQVGLVAHSGPGPDKPTVRDLVNRFTSGPARPRAAGDDPTPRRPPTTPARRHDRGPEQGA